MRMQKTKAEILSRQYTCPYLHKTILSRQYTCPYLHKTIHSSQYPNVLKLLKEVNVYKAIVPDLIPNSIMKDCFVELAPILTRIYQNHCEKGDYQRTG